MQPGLPRDLPRVSFTRPSDGLLLAHLAGTWHLGQTLPGVKVFETELASGAPVAKLVFDAGDLGEWDTGLLLFLMDVLDVARGKKVQVDRDGLPEGVHRLLDLATAVPPRGARAPQAPGSLVTQLGRRTLRLADDAAEMLSFVGEASITFGRFLRGKGRYRRSDLWVTVQEVGPDALPIVSLISFLVGLILAFVGAVQLRQFGAQIYVADLVGLAMAREMAPIMAGIIMAGRTGAAFAAQLGTMQVNEEVDALKTLGIPPMDFLVLPRMLALMVMMPLLTLYADLVGIAGGVLVGVGMLNLGLAQYLNETVSALDFTQFGIGLVKSVVFGVLVALAGCMRGIQCGRSAAAVGAAATSAVVLGIVFIITTDGLFAVITNILGI